MKRFIFVTARFVRKPTSSAFNAAIVTDEDHFSIIAGKEQLKSYASSAGVKRHFCANCGSHIFSSRDGQNGIYRLRAGTLNIDIHPQNKIHIFAAEKASWDSLCDDGQVFEGRPS